MADNSDTRESENNSWVIAGSEALPVEDLGLGTAEEPPATEAPSKESSPASSGERESPIKGPARKETKPEALNVESDLPAEKIPTAAETPEPGPVSSSQTEGKADEPPRPAARGPAVIHELSPIGEEPTAASSGEDFGVREQDVEGLRRRKGQDVAPAGLGGPRNRDEGAHGGEDGDQTKWLFGLLALLGLGVLVVLGIVLDTDDVPVDISPPWPNSDADEPHPATDGSQHEPASPPPELPASTGPQRAKEDLRLPTEGARTPQSLEAMGVLLDKLAKENQDIRLMQAELQAQKEELQGLLRKTEGEALAFTSQQQALAAENARLTEALQREKASLVAAQAELRRLLDKSPGDGRPGAEPPRDGRRPPPEETEAEIRRLRALLASVGQDVARASRKIPPGEGAEGLRAELSGVGRRLAREMEGEEAGGPEPLWRDGTTQRKEKTWRKRPGHPGEDHPGRQERPKDHPSVHKMPSDAQPARKHPVAKDAKTGKDWEHPRGVRKVKKPTEPSALWERLATHRYRAPHGCTGVAACAQQEGLVPVQKAVFLPLVQSYLAGLGWEEYDRPLAEAVGGFFRSDGAFAHDRLSFVDFLDKVEDALEELARSLGRSREEADDFEEVILRQVGAAPETRGTKELVLKRKCEDQAWRGDHFFHGFTQRNSGQQYPKERKSEGFGRKNGREHRVYG